MLTRFRQGDKAAFGELYSLYFEPVCAYLRQYTHDIQSAEDAAQEAFIKAHDALRQHDQDIRFRPWIKVIARNTLFSAHRKTRHEEAWPQTEKGDDLEVETALSVDEPARLDPQTALEQQETHALIWAAAAALTQDRFSALYLTYVAGYQGAEVAEILGKEPDSIRQFLKKARTGLGEAGYAQWAKGALRSLPCVELRQIVEVMAPNEPLDEAEQKGISRHVRACSICLEHVKRIPVTDYFAPLPRRHSHQTKLPVASCSIQSMATKAGTCSPCHVQGLSFPSPS